MSNELRPPIILFGNTRSGTSLVQNVVSAHQEIVSWYEPHGLWRYADPAKFLDEFDERDATPKVKRYIRKQFLKYQQQHGGRVIFEKSPPNILRAPYVRAVFPEATFLYVVRNPFSFISSVELKWQKTVTGKGILRRLKDTPVSQLHYWAWRYAKQQFNKRILRRKYLSIWGPKYEGIEDDVKNNDLLTVIARQWAVPSRKAEQAFAQFEEGQLLRLRYEDFVENPMPELERICAHCNIELTDEIVNAARTMIRSDRQHKWRRFDPDVLAKILPEILDEMERHGYDIPPEISHTVEPDYERPGIS